jgi:signal transduction histidine kinase
MTTGGRRDVGWEAAVVAAAFAAAAVAVWLTLRADFLAHPGWLAAQKADFVLGPVLVGLYWRRRRPQNRFGPLLIVFGFLQVPYILESASTPLLFSFGALWEAVIYISTLALILAFPSGRLAGVAAPALVGAGALAVVVPGIAAALLSPHIAPEGSISGCRATCPTNPLLVSAHPALALQLYEIVSWAIVAIALATAALEIWRLASGSPPRRRAFAIGTPIAVLFLLAQATYQMTRLLGGPASTVHAVQWIAVGARAAIWYGFLGALVAAEIYAAGVLRRIVRRALGHPSFGELEAMLREPLGDPEMRLALWGPSSSFWTDANGVALEPPAPATGRVLTEVDREGRLAAGIIHDVQLADDPELLRAAGAVALLALDNAELEAAWKRSLGELRESLARIASAGDVERHKLERDLHDGVQQRLVGLLVRLRLTGERIAGDPADRRALLDLEDEMERAIEELREVAHGIYPSMLGDEGLAAALRSVALGAGATLELEGADGGRYPTEIESAIYYCCREAVQNASKHGGAGARIAIRLQRGPDALVFEVRDAGPGFDGEATTPGAGLRNMQDRLSAVGGRLVIDSTPGQGTIVSGVVPLRQGEHDAVFEQSPATVSDPTRPRPNPDRARSAPIRRASSQSDDSLHAAP